MNKINPIKEDFNYDRKLADIQPFDDCISFFDIPDSHKHMSIGDYQTYLYENKMYNDLFISLLPSTRAEIHNLKNIIDFNTGMGEAGIVFMKSLNSYNPSKGLFQSYYRNGLRLHIIRHFDYRHRSKGSYLNYQENRTSLNILNDEGEPALDNLIVSINKTDTRAILEEAQEILHDLLDTKEKDWRTIFNQYLIGVDSHEIAENLGWGVRLTQRVIRLVPDMLKEEYKANTLPSAWRNYLRLTNLDFKELQTILSDDVIDILYLTYSSCLTRQDIAKIFNIQYDKMARMIRDIEPTLKEFFEKKGYNITKKGK